MTHATAIKQGLEPVFPEEFLDEERAEELRRSQSQDIIEREIELRHQEPIVAAMKRAKITLPEVGDWLTARHAPERNEAIREIDSVDPDLWS